MMAPGQGRQPFGLPSRQPRRRVPSLRLIPQTPIPSAKRTAKRDAVLCILLVGACAVTAGVLISQNRTKTELRQDKVRLADAYNELNVTAEASLAHIAAASEESRILEKAQEYGMIMP